MGELVSVIIPVYNVEKYLDQCLESVTVQTYRELEIIIIYDKCEDNTLELCRSWREKDKRVFLIENAKRGGLGAARNAGLEKARGEFIVYVDSDDWLKADFIEKLYREITESGADYVSSKGYYEINGDRAAINQTVPAGRYDDYKMKEALFISDHVCVWKKMYRKKWLDDNHLQNPALFYYEDWGMYPTIIWEADKISVIDEIGVYYRAFREGALSEERVAKEVLEALKEALQYWLHYLKRKNLRKGKDKSLSYYCFKNYYYRLKYARKFKDISAICFLDSLKRDVLEKEFGKFDFEKYHYIAFGSFSLRWEVQKAIFIPENLNSHYCFSSLISIMSKCRPVRVEHGNLFRKKMVEADMEARLLDEIKTMGNNVILFIDFLEERYDIMELETGTYLTMSDAFLEADKCGLAFKRIISWGSREYMNLWKKSCTEFIYYMKEYLDEKQIFYVANRMSLCYGDFYCKENYKEERKIEKINEVLQEMEEYFLGNFPGVTKTEVDRRFAFTDKDFRLGCEPQYMSNLYYSIAGMELSSKIKEREKEF